MKIAIDKNLVFSDQPKPILTRDVPKKIKSRKVLTPMKAVSVDLNLNLPTEGVPKAEVILDKRKQSLLRVANFNVGHHVFPPNVKAIEIPTLGAKTGTFSNPLVTDAFIPNHLELRTVPSSLPVELQTQTFFRAFPDEKDKKHGNQATTIFYPDNRIVFNSTAYPWGTCGRVDSPLGQGSGVMVGPRHLLTVSHVIQWNNNGTAGWVRFRPAYFAPSAPFGDAWAILIYSKMKVVGPTIDWIEGMYDYVCCVLDRDIGNWTGWMGAKGYTDSWDGRAYWTHVGYPGDKTGGNRPTYQGGISLDGVWNEPDSHEAMSHRGDVWPGQSGGPFFAWWSDGPYVVATQSSQNSNENNASGGQDMVDLILQARSQHP
jgi:V8-like Glu-specific endopeptidase